jgi:outer membrane protein
MNFLALNFSTSAVLFVAAFTASGACLAQIPLPQETQWGLGLAGGVRQRPYRDDEAEKRVLPLPFVDSTWFRVAGTGVDLKLPSAGAFTFALRATYQFAGYDSGDAPILAGLADRKSSAWLGGAVTWHDPMADISFEGLADASGHSDGQQWRVTVERAFQMGALELRPRVGATWLDSKYVDYYFGVRADEAIAGRPQYDGSSTFEEQLGLRTSYRLDRHQSMFFDLSATHLGNSITNSPLVDRSTVGTAALGYLYRF